MSLTLVQDAPAITPTSGEPPYIVLRRSLTRQSLSRSAEVEVFDDTPSTRKAAESNAASLKTSDKEWFYFARRVDRVSADLLETIPRRSWDINPWWKETCLPESEQL